jgi:voltage-gated potassium channel Kch
MSEMLNFRDRRVVRSYMRPGLIISLLIIALSILASFIITNFNPDIEELSNRIIMGGILIALIVGWFMNRSYLRDLSAGRKIIESGILVSKYVLGKKLFFSIDGKEYKVEDEIWGPAMEGDELELHYSIKSRILLEMCLVGKGISVYY